MSQHIEHEFWQIDPVTSMVKPVDDLHDPVVVVVEQAPSLSIAIASVCDFLQVRVEHVVSAQELAQVLHETQPIAVMSEAHEVDCCVYDLLMAVAGYDPGLPVLMVLDDHMTARGALDAAQKLWQLTDVIRIGQRPGIRKLIDFLFLAGRKSGGVRPLPA